MCGVSDILDMAVQDGPGHGMQQVVSFGQKLLGHVVPLGHLETDDGTVLELASVDGVDVLDVELVGFELELVQVVLNGDSFENSKLFLLLNQGPVDLLDLCQLSFDLVFFMEVWNQLEVVSELHESRVTGNASCERAKESLDLGVEFPLFVQQV